MRNCGLDLTFCCQAPKRLIQQWHILAHPHKILNRWGLMSGLRWRVWQSWPYVRSFFSFLWYFPKLFWIIYPIFSCECVLLLLLHKVKEAIWELIYLTLHCITPVGVVTKYFCWFAFYVRVFYIHPLHLDVLNVIFFVCRSFPWCRLLCFKPNFLLPLCGSDSSLYLQWSLADNSCPQRLLKPFFTDTIWNDNGQARKSIVQPLSSGGMMSMITDETSSSPLACGEGERSHSLWVQDCLGFQLK